KCDRGPGDPDLHPGVPGAQGRSGVGTRRRPCHPCAARHPADPAPQPRGRPMRVARREIYAGRAFLAALVAITILPFWSIFTTALHPSGSVPVGLSWPADPRWGNFIEAFKVANMAALLASSVFIVVAVVPLSLVISAMAGFAIGLLRIPGS